MFYNDVQKLKAIALRRNGKSYTEILRVVPVAKSTLSLWLRDVGLSTRQKQRLTQKRLDGIKKGGLAKRTQRLVITERIQSEAKQEIGKITDRELFLIGVALYWAEGSKQKEHLPSTGIIFANSDPQMITVFLRWLTLLGITREQLIFELYVHESGRSRLVKMKMFWSKILKSSITDLKRVYFKKDKIDTLRKNTGASYYGLIRIKVRASTNLNRRVTGLISGICCSQ